MKFSIVITTYNRIALLKRAIDSALKQTIPCEVVVADDASSDQTEDYVRSLSSSLIQQGDHRLVYHRNPSNLGHSATMNAGVKAASGDWIKPVDDDDYLALNCIEEMNKAIETYQTKVNQNSSSQAVICSCQASQIDPNGTELSRTRLTGPGKVYYIPQEDIHYGMLLEQVPFGTPIQVAYSKEAFIKSGGWDSSLDTNCDDIDSWIKISQFGDAIFINQCLAYRTIWPGAFNQKISLKKRLDTNILIKEKIYELVNKKYQIQLPRLEHIRDYLKLHWSLVALKRAKIKNAIGFSSKSLFSAQGWKLLISSLLNRRQQWSKLKQMLKVDKTSELSVKKIILIE
ncbi:glycosyltransferase family 2 protein [Planktothrix agardhii]|uniref:glycosyltransferase family 2 protein n=1 Tax=Planktothrix agardhii TaxID=1160 RepID=UPI0020A78EAA|nr:glycosyltransferase family 2 protein [Planktothrix agardhii]CAD5968520.1 putative glycosyltransferase YwdF [Planktothrix agardhii]